MEDKTQIKNVIYESGYRRHLFLFILERINFLDFPQDTTEKTGKNDFSTGSEVTQKKMSNLCINKLYR